MSDDPENQPDLQEILSQSEVEQLLNQVQEEQHTVCVHGSGRDMVRKDLEHIQPYDFRHPSYLSSSELRRLRLRHEEFIRTLTARLSIYLRLEIGIQMSRLETTSFEKFTESLTNPTHLSLIKTEPFKGVGILEIHPRLGLTIVDRLLGGPAHSVEADREISEIEMALLDQAIHTILEEWCAHWADLFELRHKLVGHESNGSFLQTASPDTIMLVLGMEFRIGDCLEQMQLAFPCSALEPLIRRLSEMAASEKRPTERRPVVNAWDPRFDHVELRLRGVWNDLVLSAREITRLKVGDVIQLQSHHVRNVRLHIADLPKFTAQLGAVGEKRALEITQIHPSSH